METIPMPTVTLENVTVGDIQKELQERFHLGQSQRIQSATLLLEGNDEGVEGASSQALKNRWQTFASRIKSHSPMKGVSSGELKNLSEGFKESLEFDK